MTVPDYPLLTPGGYEMYQLAQIATFIADRLARHRHSAPGLRGRQERAAAIRDIAGATTALDSVLGSHAATSPHELPRPLDRASYERARRLAVTEPRTTHVVALPDTGTWAVIGTVPGLGPVGAQVQTSQVAEAIRSIFMTAPTETLRPWAVTDRPTSIPSLPDRVDLASFVNHLDPGHDGHRAVAVALRGSGRTVDAAVRSRFPEIPAADVSTPPPASARPSAPRRTARTQPRPPHRMRSRPRPPSAQTSATAVSEPSTIAGP